MRDDQGDEIADVLDQLPRRRVERQHHRVLRCQGRWSSLGGHRHERREPSPGRGRNLREAWRQVLDQAAVVEMCRVGLGRRGSRG